MVETRKLAAILAADVAGYSRLAAADEERTVARLRTIRSELFIPVIAAYRGRVVKQTGDGSLIEFRSVVDAVRCAIELQDGMATRNAALAAERQILFRVGIHLGDVIEEEDGDLMGDGVNIAARLEGIAEPGGIYLSRAAHEQVDGKIAERFGDLGAKELKNIAKPVHVFAIRRIGGQPGHSEHVPATPTFSAPRLSIVVLPFDNIGGDPEQEYFVDGVTESLTTDLSRIIGFLVIGRSTAFTYKGKALDVKQIGRQLNVRYVLEGSVQRSGNRLRINVQLVEAETDAHLWAERFDKPVGDLFEMQDEIVSRLAAAIEAQLVAAEARRAERTANPDSMDLCFQGMAAFHKGSTREQLTEAHAFFERALALDPNNIGALVGQAIADVDYSVTFHPDDRHSRYVAAEAAAKRALALAPDHAQAHFALGAAYTATNRPMQAIAECEQALALDRNCAAAHALIGVAKLMWLGRGIETEAHVREALRLSPRDTYAYEWMFLLGAAKMTLGNYEEAVAWLQQSVETNRNYSLAHFYFAAALTLVGRMSEAQEHAKAGLALDPGFTVRSWQKFLPKPANAEVAARIERLCEAFRQAGLPDQ
jgi:TolB-like protein/class 3 adenylate cyclase/Tfp pilus assembly protein PilF